MHVVETDDAPKPVGAYSQGIADGKRVYVSGQVGMDPETNEVVSDDIGEQTTQAVANIAAILEEAGTSLENALKVTVYLADIEAFEPFNEAYGDAMPKPYPARSALQAGALYDPFRVEIDVIAAVE